VESDNAFESPVETLVEPTVESETPTEPSEERFAEATVESDTPLEVPTLSVTDKGVVAYRVAVDKAVEISVDCEEAAVRAL